MPRSPSNGSVLALSGVAAASALLAGWIEIAVTQTPRLRGDLTFTDADSLWITPLANLLILLPWGMLLGLLHARLPRLFTRERALFLLLLPACFGVCWLFFPRVHRIAIVVLSLGLALRAARAGAQQPEVFARRARLVGRALGAVTTVVALVATAGPPIGEWWTLRTMPQPAPGRPNIVLLILDTVRAKSLSLYGYARPTTPRLEALAPRSTVFRQAFAVGPWTLPSHASMFTGRYPYELSTDWTRPLDGSHRVLAEALSEAGYRTGGFVGNIEYTAAETGLARGFLHYEDWPRSLGRVLEGSSLSSFLINNARVRQLLQQPAAYTRKDGQRIVNDFLSWMHGTQSSGRPFFAFLNFLDAHEPYFVPEPYESMFGTRPDRGRGLIYPRRATAKRPLDERLSAAELAAEERAYEGSIAYLDHVIGTLVDSLDRQGVLSNTVVVITSDHGELFGEFGFARHGNTLYPQALHVPLVVVHPKAGSEARVVESPVTLRDLAATLLGISGIRDDRIPGTSLEAHWQRASPSEASSPSPSSASPLLSELWAAPNQPSWFPVVHGYMRSLADSSAMLIRRGDGLQELIALPAEVAITARDSSAEARTRDLAGRLDRVPSSAFPGRGSVSKGSGATNGAPR